MSKVEEILKARRQAQIAALEGREPDVDPEELKKQTEAVKQEASRVAAKDSSNSRRASQTIPRARLFISKHARKRMSQRGMRMKDVAAIWHFGEPLRLNDGRRHAYAVSDSALKGMPKNVRDHLTQYRGAAIIVQDPEPPYEQPLLVTVLADGVDTYFG